MLRTGLPKALYADAPIRLHLALCNAALCDHLGDAVLAVLVLHTSWNKLWRAVSVESAAIGNARGQPTKHIR